MNYKISALTGVGKLEYYEEFIDRYFKNIQEQTMFNDIEFVITYVEWTDKFEKFKKLSNVKLIKDNEKKGCYGGWNLCLKHSTADLVTNWNIDDYRFSNNCELKYDILTKEKDIDFVYNYCTDSSDINETFENFDWSYDRRVFMFPDNFHKYVFQCCMGGPDPMWRKSLHDEVGYFDWKDFPSAADWELWIKFALNGSKFKLIPEVLCLFFTNPNNVSSVMGEEKKNQEHQRLIDKYKNEIPKFETKQFNIELLGE